MVTLCESYPTVVDARRAADALHAAGVPSHAIGILADSRYHDVRAERVGGFAGPVEPEAPFGKYSGPARRRWRAAGGFAGDPDRQRQGSFADGEGEPAVTFDHEGQHDQLTSDETRRVLADAHVGAAAMEKMLSALHSGGVVMFAAVSAPDRSRPDVPLDG